MYPMCLQFKFSFGSFEIMQNDKNNTCLDQCILKRLARWSTFEFISDLKLTALLNPQITVNFLYISLPVTSGSQKRIYSKLYRQFIPLFLNTFLAIEGKNTFIFFILFVSKMIRKNSHTYMFLNCIVIVKCRFQKTMVQKCFKSILSLDTNSKCRRIFLETL